MKNSNPYNSGIADCWYSSVCDAWIEYKFIVVPKRFSTMINLTGGKNPPITPLQQKWLHERHSEGRTVRVIVGCADGGVVFQELSWEYPITAGDFYDQVISRKDLAAYICKLVEHPL